jgi:tetratricopeptide (TPR) repeat protein
VHEHWEAYLASQHRAYDDDPERVVKPATILFFEAEPALVPADREAFKTHGWRVAETPDGKGYPMLLVGAPSPNQPARRPNASELRDLQAAALALAQLTRERLPATGRLSGVRLDETLSLPSIGGQARVRVRFPAGVIDRGQLPSHARPTSEHMVMMEPTMWGVVSRHGGAGLPPELRKAQQLVYKARESDNPARRLALAHQALAISADCADAYVLLAEEEADTRLRARDLFAQGVAAGERALGPDFFLRERGHFWGMIATRPYMRARNGLGLVLWELGEHQAALDHFRAMLDLNPGDNQGVRYLAALLMLELWQTEALVRLIADQAEDGSAAWLFNGALAHFRHAGDSAEARARLAEARAGNPHVIDFLLQRQRLDAERADFIGHGDRSEAVAYAHDALSHWRRTPGAIAWLRTMTEHST